MKRIPILLVYSRVLIALAIAFFSFSEVENYKEWIIGLIVLGVFSDIFDGVIARKLEVATEKLRKLDSNIDQFFWLTSVGSIGYLNFQFFKQNHLLIVIILVLEILAYLISFLKFKKTIATHTLLAKLWVLTLLAFLIDLMINNDSNLLFWICVSVGIVSRIEIITIILTLKKWATDIPSICVVSKINKGIKAKKRLLF